MTQRELLLAAILADHADDLARLAYADLLEEEGRPTLAGFIRGEVLDPRYGRRYGGGTTVMDHATGTLTVPPGGVYEYRRGFIEKVACPLPIWRDHGPAVAATHPVVRVELTDKTPDTSERAGPGCTRCFWRTHWTYEDGASPATYEEDQPSYLPWDLFDLLPHVHPFSHSTRKYFDDEAAAVGFLSDALIAWARSQQPASV